MTTARGLLLASGMLASLALAGFSRAKDRVHDSEKTSNKETAMTHPADESRNFTLTFRSEMDRVAPGLYAHMEVTRVDGRSGRAVMLVNRPGSDVAGVPVGLFGATLSPEQIGGLAAAIEGIKWGELPKPKAGDVNAATLSIDYARGSRIIQRSFNASNGELLNLIAPVLARMTELAAVLEAQPQRAVTVAAARTAAGFKLVFQNIGKGRVLLANPRAPGATPGSTRGGVSVAEKEEQQPGVFAVPPVFTPIALQPAGHDVPAIILGPGQSHEVDTVAWVAPRPGTYFVRATWEDYTGPEADPKSVLPMIPSPEQLAEDRPYPLRGAAFSKAVKFTIDKGGR